MVTLDDLKGIIGEVLQISDQMVNFGEGTQLLGGIPEFDSMAVVSILTMIEDNYGVIVDDDDVSAENFETIGSLLQFVNTIVV